MREMRAAAVKRMNIFLGDLDRAENERTEVTETLGGEGSSHHAASNLSGSKLGGDNCGKWVITTDADTHLKSCCSIKKLAQKGKSRPTMNRHTTRTPMI